MEIHLDCLPCTLRQALEASRMSTDDTELQKTIMDEAIRVLGQYRSLRTPPEMAREMQRIVRERTGVPDPYFRIKQEDLRMTLGLYPKLKQLVEGRKDRLYWALKISVIGNALDSGIYIGYDLEENINVELKKTFALCDISLFRRQLKTAKNVLVIGDNTGETVLDRLLLEQLPHLDLNYAVRSAPIINDATIAEAKASGLDQHAEIISTGCDLPGVLLDECGKTFLDIFHNSDIVISKGQGNYETLWNTDSDRGIFFLLKVKCPVISELMNVGLNEYVFKYDKCNRIKN